MRKRDVLASAFSWTGLSLAVIYARRLTGSRLPILAYHRVLPELPDDRFVFDPHLVSTTTDEFRWQMEFIARHFEPMSLEDVLAAIESNAKLPANAVVVTFDDGYDDNYHEAYPVLQQCGIPATFFIATGYINGTLPFWYDWLSAIIVGNPASILEVSTIGERYTLSPKVSERREVYETLANRLKGVPNQERLAVLDELESRYGEVYRELGDSVSRASRPMTEQQLAEMARGGMQFGSHTVSHPILARLSDDELRSELIESRKRLREWTGQEISLLAYPNGGLSDFSDRVVATAREAGYRLAVAYVSGENQVGQMSPFSLRRIPVDLDVNRALFKLALGLPRLVD